MEGVIVAIICVLGFLGVAGFIVYKILQGPKLPKGFEYNIKRNDNEIILIVDKNLNPKKKDAKGSALSWTINEKEYLAESLLDACASSIECTEWAFLENNILKADEKKLIVYFATDDVFENLRGPANVLWAKNVSAWSEIVSGIFGTNKTPKAVIRTRYIKDVIERGQPLIHELVHILNKAANGDYSHSHEDPKLWLGPGKDESVEGKAANKFINKV